MHKFVIGKKTHEVEELSFKVLKKLWPMIQGVIETKDLLQSMEKAVEMAQIILEKSTGMTVEQIEEELLAPEILPLQVSVMECLTQSGLVNIKKDGTTSTGEAVGADAPSTEISTQ